MLLHADITGEGPPVALLHGLFGRARNLAGVARALAPCHRVLSLDLRNHGDSPHAAGMDYASLAQDVLDTLAARDALPAALLGHSMGGKTAMACALLAPLHISRLLIADIAPLAYAHHNLAVADALRAIPMRPQLTRKDAAEFLTSAVPDPAVRSFLLQNLVPGAEPAWRIGLDHIWRAMADIEGWPDFPGIPIFANPTLFVSGAQSDYMSASGRHAARALFPAARFLTLKNAGHWLHADQAAAFHAIAKAFFDGGD